jgi:hypothetical protein
MDRLLTTKAYQNLGGMKKNRMWGHSNLLDQNPPSVEPISTTLYIFQLEHKKSSVDYYISSNHVDKTIWVFDERLYNHIHETN